VLGFGDQVEVLAPRELRAAVFRVALQMARQSRPGARPPRPGWAGPEAGSARPLPGPAPPPPSPAWRGERLTRRSGALE
jgi:hypothetical protein